MASWRLMNGSPDVETISTALRIAFYVLFVKHDANRLAEPSSHAPRPPPLGPVRGGAKAPPPLTLLHAPKRKGEGERQVECMS